jgi:hypothetical protein
MRPVAESREWIPRDWLGLAYLEVDGWSRGDWEGQNFGPRVSFSFATYGFGVSIFSVFRI